MCKNLPLYSEKPTNLPSETVSAVQPSLITPLYLHGNLHSLFFAGPSVFVRHFSPKKNIAIVIPFAKHCFSGDSLLRAQWSQRLGSWTLVEQLKFKVSWKNDKGSWIVKSWMLRSQTLDAGVPDTRGWGPVHLTLIEQLKMKVSCAER